jgi:putative ABC transport system permease protein
VAKLIGRQASGVLVGIGAVSIAGHAIRTLLYDISPQNPQSLTVAIFLVTLTAVLATVIPVLDASETEPAETLRAEN